MSTLILKSTIANEVVTYSSKLAGWWPFSDSSGNNATDKSDNSDSLQARNSPSANFWTDNPGKGTFQSAALDIFGDTDETKYLIGSTDNSFIFSCWLKADNALAAGGTVMSKRNQSSGDGMDLIFVSGVLRNRYKTVAGSNQNLIGTTDILDTNEHNVVFVCDKTGSRGLYIDGVDDVSSGITDMTNAALTGDADSGTDFIIGGNTNSITSGTINSALYDGTYPVQLWDTQLYITTGGLPSNLDDIVHFLSRNQYSPITQELWA